MKRGLGFGELRWDVEKGGRSLVGIKLERIMVKKRVIKERE